MNVTSVPVPNPDKLFSEQPLVVLLAQLVWGEARGESAEGKQAVAYVPINRLHHPGFDSNLVRVILHPSQFSCFLSTDPNRKKLMRPQDWERPAIWAECYQIALDALLKRSEDLSREAVFYHSAQLPGPPKNGGYALSPDADGVYRDTHWGDVIQTAHVGTQSFYKLV